MDAGLSLVLKFLFVALAAGAVFIGKKYFGAKDDHVIEEMVEYHIEQHTGIDVDLSPESPEKEEARRLQRLIKRSELISPID